MRFVHHELAKINTQNYRRLVQGIEIPGLEGLRGKDLDYALVEREQNAVEQLTELYFKQNPKADRKAILESVSRATDPTPAEDGDSVWQQTKAGAINEPCPILGDV